MEEDNRIFPEPDDDLPRQTSESYIEIDADANLELRHFKAVLVLSSLSGMDLNNPQNALAAEKALNGASDLLSQRIIKWHWLDRKGEPYNVAPIEDPSVIDNLTMNEINWMIENISGQVQEKATSGGT
ncbi:MAG: hypothetical protein AMJ88_13425 [Anaerolineae bacterium SM23_ 63]|nr:MAG: hypothetical protein AMJ88_13425 [Anaerolineae bacterium SM23_ 63]